MCESVSVDEELLPFGRDILIPQIIEELAGSLVTHLMTVVILVVEMFVTRDMFGAARSAGFAAVVKLYGPDVLHTVTLQDVTL